jgi:hypothetical protein
MMPLGHKFVLATLALFSLILPIQTPFQFLFWHTLIVFIISLIVLALVLYVAGLLVVGGDKARLSSAFAIALLGVFVDFVLNMAFTLLLLSVSIPWEYIFIFRIFLSLIVWLSLIKNFYKTGWLGSLAVAILAVTIMVVLGILLESLLIALNILI